MAVRAPTELEKARNTLRLAHHYWLIAAREALQGDTGKLRRYVAMSEGKTLDELYADMSKEDPANV